MRDAPKKQSGFSFSAPIYPFLLAVYPILSLLAYNLGEIRPAAAMRALLISLAVSAAVFASLRALLRDIHRAALVTGSWLFLFFIYGHLQIFLPNQPWTRLGVLLPLWIGLALLSLTFAWRARPNVRGLSAPLNAFTLLLTGMSIWQFGSYDLKLTHLLETPPAPQSLPALRADSSAPLPDVYLFILDSYARADTLQNVYDFDNSQFVSDLEEMGFYVARCSQSNYDRTELALSSSMNLDYLQTLDPSLTPETGEKTALWGLIRNNALRRSLEAIGYQTIAFATGYPWSELTDADVYIQPELKWSDLNEFETLALRTTLVRGLQDLGLADYDQQEYQRQRERTLLTLETLESLPEADGPKFVFVHLLDPHPPFVFDENGNLLDAEQFVNARGKYTPESYARGYIIEMQFVNREITRTVRALIEKSAVPPIIIIQGDHGPWFHPPETVLTILNAYHLPGHNDELYPGISPVNTFRIVLNDYFGTNLPLLEDVNYNSPAAEPYNYEVVPNRCK